MIGENLINRKYSSITLEALKLMRNRVCVFISYQSADRKVAREVANYLINAGVSVYFDENDSDLKIANQTNNPKAITESLLKGISKSTHMLCIISPQTLHSKWVPFEIGFGYDKVDLGVVLLNGVQKKDLPEYIYTTKYILSGFTELGNFTNTLLDKMSRFKRINERNR